MKNILILGLILTPLCATTAQERTASGNLNNEASWSTLKNLVDGANNRASLAQTLATAIKNCGDTGMLYGPLNANATSGTGCVGVSSIPQGAVMAFNRSSCPTGWSEYIPARGRFIRGVDASGANDPSGTRPIGSVQMDAMQNVKGHFSGNNMTPDGPFGRVGGEDTSWGKSGGGRRWWLDFDMSRVARTTIETRPKNVALLYCQAD